MSLPEHLRNLRSGAINEGTEHLYGDGLHPRQAAAIADAIFSEPQAGHDGPRERGGWDLKRDALKPGEKQRGLKHSGIPPGYGDPRTR